jgi:hypothetical protein
VCRDGIGRDPFLTQGSNPGPHRRDLSHEHVGAPVARDEVDRGGRVIGGYRVFDRLIRRPKALMPRARALMER